MINEWRGDASDTSFLINLPLYQTWSAQSVYQKATAETRPQRPQSTRGAASSKLTGIQKAPNG